MGARWRLARIRSWTAGVVVVRWHSTCGTVTRSVPNENGRGGVSPGCGWHLAKSMVRPLSRQGVPVLNRARPNPAADRLSLMPSADWSPARPPAVLASPVCMTALRKVPVVSTTHGAR